MIHVNITELRNHLPSYMGKVKGGEEVAVTLRGKVIARLIPEVDESTIARQRLAAIRKDSFLGDVVSPTGETWEAERDTP